VLSQYAGEQHALSRVLPDGVMQRSFDFAVLFWFIYLYPHITRARAMAASSTRVLRVLERRQKLRQHTAREALPEPYTW